MPGLGRGYSRPFSQLTDPGRTVMITEGTSWWLNAAAVPDSNRIRRWNNNSANILWCDGTVSSLNPKTELRQTNFFAVK
jgi:prepilin-type processing-associated H-X9-DG protein